jgi:hypothetical protein
MANGISFFNRRSARRFGKKAVEAVGVSMGTAVFCGVGFGVIGGVYSLLTSDFGFLRGFGLFFLGFGPYTGCAGLIVASVEFSPTLQRKLLAGAASGIIGALSLCFYFDVLTNDRFNQIDLLDYLTWPAFWGACGLFMGLSLGLKKQLEQESGSEENSNH